MARFCICGCGKQLLTKDGATDYDRMFFSTECRSRDKTQRIRDMRAKIKRQDRCPKCGQVIPKEKKARTANA